MDEGQQFHVFQCILGWASAWGWVQLAAASRSPPHTPLTVSQHPLPLASHKVCPLIWKPQFLEESICF